MKKSSIHEELIQKLLQEAPAYIVAGLKSDKSNVVVDEFELLLRTIIEAIDPSQYPNFEKLVLGIGRDLIKEISEFPPEQRLEFTKQKLLIKEIGYVDRNSRKIAEQSLSDAPDLPALQTQARIILEKILEIDRLLEKRGSEWQKQHGRTLSEARLDCEFVLGNHSKSSIRLGRTISYLQSTGNWPPSDDVGR